LSNLETAAFYEIGAIAGEKLVEHVDSLHWAVSWLCAVPYTRAGPRGVGLHPPAVFLREIKR
jgi:hypothetical protein